MRAPKGPNYFNFMQFMENVAKLYVGNPWSVGAPPRGNPGSITKFHSFLCSFQETIDPLGLVPVCEIMDPPLNPLDPSLTAVNS